MTKLEEKRSNKCLKPFLNSPVKGKLIFADGSKYEGQFESDRKHGVGKPEPQKAVGLRQTDWQKKSHQVHLQQWFHLRRAMENGGLAGSC